MELVMSGIRSVLPLLARALHLYFSSAVFVFVFEIPLNELHFSGKYPINPTKVIACARFWCFCFLFD